MYNTDEQRHIALVGTSAGQVHEIYWKSDTVGVEGTDALPVDFGQGGIVAVSGHYAIDQQRYVVVVGTSAGQVHEIFWKSDTWGSRAPTRSPWTSVTAASSTPARSTTPTSDATWSWSPVGTDGYTKIFWKELTVGIEGHDELPLDFRGAGGIVAVSGYYDAARRRLVVVVGATDGKVHQVYWQTLTVGIEAHSVVAQFPAGSIRDVGGFVAQTDGVEHIVVALNTGAVFESWLLPSS